MIGQYTHDTERKINAILKVLSDSSNPLGGRVISRRLREQGVDLNERTVRYHLKMMDERGLTRSMGQRDGRSITGPGIEELNSALVYDKLGMVSSRIELLAYLTTFEPEGLTGNIPIDVSVFPKGQFAQAWDIMRDVFASGFCTSNLVAVASGGQRLGDVIIPQDKIGLATVCSAAIVGGLLKTGIPIDSRFGGILQIRNREPARFVDLIEYNGCTLDPFHVFIAGRMTNVTGAVKIGEGKILASFHEVPLPSRPATEAVLNKFKALNICHWLSMGTASEPICDIPARTDKVGLALPSGLNAIAAVVEKGIEVSCKSMNSVIEINKLRSFWAL
ncbi:MAG TPA: NrpR regulatory domain-containing protein [Dehalococcoidia bacterium]|jgi:repressor of nif and glnA expression